MYKLYQKILSATLFFLLVSIMTYAQTKITGTVNETDGSSIPGATVVVKGTKIITSTNVDGKFAIEAPSDAVLTISFTGYQTLDVSVNGRSQITAVLSVASTTLSDVVVVGYGTQKKVNLSGAVNTVDTKNIVNRPVTSLTSALQGAVPGMAIKATPGDVGNDLGTINIRGRGNLGASEPLYVLDGVIVSAGDFARINSNDVASISVLKDASASAIYGSRAAFGVILVTTKKGKSGSMQLHYNSYYGIQSATVLPSWVGAYDYAVLRNEAAANTGKSAVFSADALSKIQNQTDPDRYPDNDWYALTLKESAPVMEHQLDISGGDKTRYYLSGAYFKQNSLVPGKDLERYSLRANTETEVSDKFKIGSNLSFVRDGFDNENGPLDFANLNRQTPLIVNKQSNGEWGSINGGSIDAPFAGRNPLRLLQNGGRDAYAQNRFLGTVTGTYTPIKGLDISGLISYNIYGVIRSTFLNTIDPILDFNTGMPIPSTAVTVNQLTERWQNTGRLLTQGTVSYESTIGEHYFKILGGASYENLNDRFTQTIRKNFASNDLNAINGGSADPLNTNATGNIQQRATESIFSRLNYSFKDRYLLEASLRYDASSQFAPGYRGGIYPSFSGAWRLSQEEFMKDVSWLG